MGKTKSKSTSKIKLSNKSTNKRMKASRRHKLNKLSKKSKTVNIPTTPIPPKENKEHSKSHTNHAEEFDNYDPIESEVSDIEDFINNSSNFSFLSADFSDRNTANNRKRKAEEGVPDYERVPRLLSTISQSTENDITKNNLLPIKGSKGIIRRSEEKPLEEKPPNKITSEIPTKNNEVTQENPPISFVELLAQRKADTNMKKLQIAQISQDIVENPEACINQLRQLLNLCAKTEATSIRKLALLSLLEIFKDIIPSYRIRELTSEEKTAAVSKDTRKVRDFEEALLSNYQKYLQVLEDSINECTTLLKRKHKIRGKQPLETSLSALKGVAMVAVKCLTQLLQNVSHFNYRGNIITVVVPAIEMDKEMGEAGKLCSDAIHLMFKEDNIGDVSLEILKVIHRLVKSKSNVKPAVLQTLLSLRINADVIQAAASRGNKIERLKEKREAIRKMSKKERKRKKMEDELSKEMQEAEAVENSSKIERLQTETLKLLFVTYFRILKSNSATPLLKPVLKGLSKFAHLINVEFFDDLMACLQTLLQSERLGVDERLSCIVTAFKILSGQGEALNIDPRHFYAELYNILPHVSTDFSADDSELLRRSLDMMILKRRKQISLPQVLGFFKRISTLLLHVNTNTLFDYILLIRNILQLHKKCDYLLDNEDFGRGIFQQDATDPELSNADGTALWEMLLLWKHYHPHITTYVKHVLHGAPSQGVGALPTKYLETRTPNSKKESKTSEEDLTDYFVVDLPEKPPKRKYHTNLSEKITKDFHSRKFYELIENELRNVDQLEFNFSL